MKAFILILACNFIGLLAVAQNSIIEGKILTEKGSIAQNVSVQLDKNIAIIVDKEGKYRFDNVTSGEHTVKVSHMSFIPKSTRVSLKDNEVKTLDFIIESKSNQILEVVIEGRKGFVDHNLSNSLRVQTPILEFAQNVQVVNSELLAKQQVFNLSDGLFRNVSGVSRETHWSDMYVNIHMRGSQIQAFRNGMNIVASYWGPLSEDMATVERVEFLKGPAGFMMSSGDPAGIYNVVTKKPTGENKGEVTFSVGSYELYRSSLDLDGKLSKDGRLLYRLNVAGTSKASFRANEDNKRFVIAPVLSYQWNESTRATLEYTYQKAKMTDVGSPYVMSPFGYKTLPRETTFSAPGLEPFDIDEHNTSLFIEHKLNENWKLTSQGTYINYNQLGASSWPQDIFTNGTLLRKSDIWDAKSTVLIGQIFLNGNIRTGLLEHKILAGLDLGQKKYFADWNQSIVLDSLNGGEFDPKSPDYSYDNGYTLFDRDLPLELRASKGGGTINSSYSSLYVQDELGMLENKLRLTLGARFTSMTMATWGGAPITSKKVTPRLGISYSIEKHTSLYGLYDQAFLPQRAGALHDGGKIKPITGNNMEIGVKRDWVDGKWNTSISWYQITKNHEITSYGPDTDMVAEIGQKKIKGLEFDLKGELFKGLNLVANYGYTDGKVSKINPGVELFYVGQRLEGADRHIINAWFDYELQRGMLKGFSLNLGAYSNIDRSTAFYSKDYPQQNIEDYLRIDGGLGYHKNKFSVLLNVQNLADKYLLEGGSYYTDYFSTAVYSWQSGAPRNYKLTVGYKF
jgi:iron complex outermembrane receptor protein